uniref:Uncharacterized protein n=1 Tax=Octopus bimaculoides TaxID=37653 RepID=A0A0L8IDU6_OCTBM
MRVKLPTDVYSKNMKVIVVDKDTYRKLKDMYREKIDLLRVAVEFDELPPVIELKDLEPFMRY